MHAIAPLAGRSRAAASRGAPRIAGLATAVPPHRVPQDQAKAFAAEVFARSMGRAAERLLSVFDTSGIEERRVCMPVEWYRAPRDFAVISATYAEQALALAARAADPALARAGFARRDVTHLLFVSTTGIATPSIDARLVDSGGFDPHVRRVPIWGLGCAGGAAGLARAAEFAQTSPRAVVLVIALELCTLAFQPHDTDARNLVATALFSDGAAAAVVTRAVPARPTRARLGVVAAVDGDETLVAPRSHVRVVASGSTLWPDTRDIMGWTVDGRGLHVVFSRDIPAFVRANLRPDLEDFLERHGLGLAALDHVVAHPGGPRVLEAYAEALGMPPARFDDAREVLRRFGNMSSPTCLFVLERTLAAGGIAPGERALLVALGPGFASEYVLLEGSAS